MSTLRLVIITCAIAALSIPSIAAENKSTEVPKEVLSKMEEQFIPPGDINKPEMLQKYLQQMNQVLEMGQAAERDYPKAENLYMVWSHMLQATDLLARAQSKPEFLKTRTEIAEKILKSKAPKEEKLVADVFVTDEKITALSDSKDIPSLIRDMANRYKGTPAEATALIYAAVLARSHDQDKLFQELLETLQKKHGNSPQVKHFLQSARKNANDDKNSSSKLFEAELTKLDGGKLKLPDDLKGKVVVIDFWATWCGPCVAEVPHMKKVYAKYKDKGVEIVGISLDKNKAQLEKFIKEKEMNWIHTYSGKGWDDPTVKKYGVDGIPSIWVVGTDGKIVSSTARGNLEETIDKALKNAK